MTETEVHFEERMPSRATQIGSAQATIRGVYQLLERALSGSPAEVDSNISCAVMWLETTVEQLKAVPKDQTHKTD